MSAILVDHSTAPGLPRVMGQIPFIPQRSQMRGRRSGAIEPEMPGNFPECRGGTPLLLECRHKTQYFALSFGNAVHFDLKTVTST